MYLLDTDILTLVHAGHPRVIQRRHKIPSAEIATTIITRIEILRGRFESVLKAADAVGLLVAQERLLRSEERLKQLVVVHFDTASSLEFERLREITKLRKVGRADLLIASIALAHQATLVTRNVKHFQQVPGLMVENWAD